ncbi:MAG: PD40 domain-containing protein [Candidatus Aminicenantes bacterium]|nr:PD40 domain-containing protein [Candidatus Aminicenantes bacterium]
MKTIPTILGITLSILITSSIRAHQEELPVLRGPYLGQKSPGIKPEIFAPGIISTGLHDDYGPAISKDGNEIYFRIWGKPHAIIWMIKRIDGKWGKPEVASFSGLYEDGGFVFSKDGKRIYFDSDRPTDNKGEPKDTDIWFVNRNENGWGEPANLGAPINSADEEYIGSVLADNTIFFTVRKRDTNGKLSFTNYSSKWENTAYSKPEKLPYPFNSDFFQIAPRFSPDETYAILVINGRDDGIGQEDLYVTFKNQDETWTEPQNLGPQINSKSTDWFPSFSPDGKYLFFVSWRFTGKKVSKTKSEFEEMMMDFYDSPKYGNGADVFWVNTKIIEELKQKKLK